MGSRYGATPAFLPQPLIALAHSISCDTSAWRASTTSCWRSPRLAMALATSRSSSLPMTDSTRPWAISLILLADLVPGDAARAGVRRRCRPLVASTLPDRRGRCAGGCVSRDRRSSTALPRHSRWRCWPAPGLVCSRRRLSPPFRVSWSRATSGGYGSVRRDHRSRLHRRAGARRAGAPRWAGPRRSWWRMP